MAEIFEAAPKVFMFGFEVQILNLIMILQELLFESTSRYTLATAKGAHVLNYQRFKDFRGLVIDSVEWLERRAATNHDSMILCSLINHGILEGLKIESEGVLREAESFFHRSLLRAAFSSRQQNTALATRISQLKTNMALVEAVLGLEQECHYCRGEPDRKQQRQEREQQNKYRQQSRQQLRWSITQHCAGSRTTTADVSCKRTWSHYFQLLTTGQK